MRKFIVRDTRDGTVVEGEFAITHNNKLMKHDETAHCDVIPYEDAPVCLIALQAIGKQKNDSDIYEADVFKSEGGELFYVYYDKPRATWVLKGIGEYRNHDIQFTDDFEKVGNVHEKSYKHLL